MKQFSNFLYKEQSKHVWDSYSIPSLAGHLNRSYRSVGSCLFFFMRCRILVIDSVWALMLHQKQDMKWQVSMFVDRIRFLTKILNEIRRRGTAPISDQYPVLDARCPLVRFLFNRHVSSNSLFLNSELFKVWFIISRRNRVAAHSIVTCGIQVQSPSLNGHFNCN